MDTEIDWQGELDRSFGVDDDQDIARYVASGRRAVRRRRAVAALVTATVVVAGSAAWAASPGTAPRSDAPIATSGPTPEQGDDSDGGQTRAEREAQREAQLEEMRELADAAADREADFGSNPAALTADGLALAPKAGPLLEQIHNPMGYSKAQGTSIAIRVMFKGREHYGLAIHSSNGSTSSAYTFATGDFDGWLAAAVRSQHTLDVANGVTTSAGELPPTDSWLTLGPDGEVQPGEEVVILAQRPDTDLGDAFAADATRSGVVRLRVRGAETFAAYRVLDGRLEVIEGPGGFGSLDAFVDWARGQYASGEGMR